MLISQIPVAIMVLRPDNIPMYVNPRFTELYGYRLQDIATPDMWLNQAYPDPDYRAEVTRSWRQILNEQSHKPGPPHQFTVTCKDGEIRHTRFRMVVLKDETRIIVMDDVTESTEAKEALQRAHQGVEARVAERTAELKRRAEQAAREIRWRDRVEQALRQSEAQYRILVETSPDSIIALDSERRIVMCNTQALELFGYSHRGEVLGRPSSILYGSEVADEMAEYRSQLEAGGHITGIEMWMRRRDGSRFCAEFSASTISDPDGELLGFVGFARDITERKRAEDAIRQRNFELRVLNEVTTAIIQSQQTLEALLDVALSQTLEALSIHSGWVTLKKTGLDKQGQHLRILKGILRPDRALFEAGKNLRKRAFDYVRRTREAVLESNVFLGLEQNDTPILCSTGYVPLTRDDEVVGVLGVLSIHQRARNQLTHEDTHLLTAIGNQISLAVKHTQLSKEAAQAAQLRELDCLRSQLIANFSHNLKSPLGIIEMSCTTLLRQDVALTHEVRRSLLDDIEAETNHLAQIVDGILDLGHLTSKDLELTKDRIRVTSVINKAIKRISNTSSEHTIRIINTAEQIEIMGDAKSLEEVVANLLDNAIKYSPQGGDVEVKLTNPESYCVKIDVIDHGVGIPESELETIFERFYRVHNEVTQQIPGNGLGLAICKGIVEAHDGRIWATSKLAYGTTLSVILPLMS